MALNIQNLKGMTINFSLPKPTRRFPDMGVLEQLDSPPFIQHVHCKISLGGSSPDGRSTDRQRLARTWCIELHPLNGHDQHSHLGGLRNKLLNTRR
jgi:hypothetical protein